MVPLKSIVIIIDYFGKWPEWFPLFIESCKWNPDVTWHIHTDCDFKTYNNIENVHFKFISLDDYIEKVNRAFAIDFKPADSYKLVDLRPLYGDLYYDEIKDYDFWGYGDIDLIYGNIRKFYTPAVLEHTVISTHAWCISGHLALIKNDAWHRVAYKRIENWRSHIENPFCQRFDEDIFLKAFFQDNDQCKLYMKEQFTTPLTYITWRNGKKEHPTVWFWKDGRITNDSDGNNEYIYLHFMNFKYPRYMNPIYGNSSFWSHLPKIVNLKPEEMANGMKIDQYGFHAICRDIAFERAAKLLVKTGDVVN